MAIEDTIDRAIKNITIDVLKDKVDIYRRYRELEDEIICLTGYDFSTLRYLFAIGYGLTPPKNVDASDKLQSFCNKQLKGENNND